MEVASGLVGVISLVVGSYAFFSRPSTERGLRVIHDGGSDFDVVFVHGVNQRRKRHMLPGTRHDKVQWMRDLLQKDFPNARLMAYGYQLDATNVSFLSQMVKIETRRLLGDLIQQRQSTAQERPLIFIAHSLGGLIVKNALADAGEAIAENEPTLKLIQSCTTSAIFFGTPLQSESQASFSSSLKRTASEELDLSAEQVSAIDPEAEVLNILVERYRSIEKRLRNYCFWDVQEFIVPEDFAFPRRGRGRWWFGADHGLSKRHRDLVKFDGPNDEGYLKLKRCIQDSTDKISDVGPVAEHTILLQKDSLLHVRTNSSRLRSRSRSSSVGWSERLTLATDKSIAADYEGAESIFFAILQSLERAGEERDKDTTDASVDVLSQLAHHYMRKDDYEKAELFFKRVYVQLKETTPDDIARAAEELENIAEACQAQGRIQEAARSLERARLTLLKDTRQDGEVLSRVEAHLADVLDQLGRHEAAQDLHAKAYRTVKRLNNNTENDVSLQILEHQAESYRMSKRHAEAEELLKGVLEARKTRLISIRTEVRARRTGSAEEGCGEDMQNAIEAVTTTVRALEIVYSEQDKQNETQELLADSMTFLDTCEAIS